MSNQEIVVRPDDAPSMGPLVGGPPAETYVSGFEGAAIQAFPADIRASLTKPVNPDDVEIREDGIIFLPGIFYRQRLFDAFGAGGWALMPRRPPMRIPQGKGELIVYFGALYCLGRYVGEAAGECTYFPNNRGMTYAGAYEGAKTDAITRCCKDLGIAWELWDPSWREQWQAKYAFKDRNGDWFRRDRPQKLPNAGTDRPPAQTAGNAPNAVRGDSPTDAPASTPTGTHAEQMIDKARELFKAKDDSGEMASDADLSDMQGLVFDKLQLDEDLILRQFFTWFGTRNPRELTKANVRAAFRLLLLWGDRDRFKAQIEKERAEGQIR